MGDAMYQRRDTLIGMLVALAVALLYFATAPQHGNIRWPDSPRHAINAVFLLDAVRAMPWSDPMSWAMRYYDQYPGLTFGFYPPLPSLLLAAMFAVLGVSTTTTVVFMCMCQFALLTGFIKFMQHILPLGLAIAAALLFGAAGETLLWGRQLMLEAPMLAFLIWSVLLYMDYLASSKASDLLWSAIWMLCAIYSKQTAGIVLVPMLIVGLLHTGKELLRRRHFWFIILCAVIALVPLFILQSKFASFNLMSIADRPDMPKVNRLGLDGLGWYLMRLPIILNDATVSLIAISLFALPKGWKQLWSNHYWRLMFFWLITAYAVLTAIALKETRHGMLMLPAFIAFGFSFCVLLPRHIAVSSMAILMSGITLAHAALTQKVPLVSGMKETADLLMAKLPQGSAVATFVYMDGPFIWRILEKDRSRKYHVTRLDKVLFNILIMPGLGLNPQAVDSGQLLDLLRQRQIRYIVFDPDYLKQEKNVRILSALLKNGPFTLIDTIESDAETKNGHVLIYRNDQALDLNTARQLQQPSVLR